MSFKKLENLQHFVAKEYKKAYLNNVSEDVLSGDRKNSWKEKKLCDLWSAKPLSLVSFHD